MPDNKLTKPFPDQVTSRLGVLPNFFTTAAAAPGLIEELWGFAKSSYLDNPLPSLFKERLFVYLSRFCPVRYCIIRHTGFLMGLGRPAGDAGILPQTIEQVTEMLSWPLPETDDLNALLTRLEFISGPLVIPAAGQQAEQDLFEALAVLFLEPRLSGRTRSAVGKAYGQANFELITAFLAFIRTAHYWTETHPELAYEPDVQALMAHHPHLAALLLDKSEAEAAQQGKALRQALTSLEAVQGALDTNQERMRVQKDAFLSAMNGGTLEDGLSMLVEMVTRETAAEARCAFYLADDAREFLHPVFGASTMPLAYLNQIDKLKIGEDSLACGLAVPTGQPVISHDVLEDPLWEPWTHLAKKYSYRGCWSFPIKTRDQKAVGTFALYFQNPREASETELAMVDVVTQTAAILIVTRSDAREKEQSEQALRESEQSLRLVLESIGEPFYVLDRDWRFVFVSRAALKVWQKSQQEVVGHIFLEAFPNEASSESYAAHQRVMDSGAAEHLESVSPILGSWIEIDLNITPNGYLSTSFRNISERKQREQHQNFLLKLSDGLRPFKNPVEIQETAIKILGQELDVMRAAYFEVDPDGVTISLTARYQKGTSTFPAQRRISDISTDRVNQFRKGQTLVICDTEHEAKPERYRAFGVRAAIAVPLVKNGQLVAIVGIHAEQPRNWTPAQVQLVEELAEHTWVALERSKAQAALLDSQKQFQSIANLVPDLLWDSQPDGSTNWYNQRWIEYTGQTLEQAIGWGWVDAIHPDDRDASAERYGKAVEASQFLQQEHRIRRHDGAYRWFVVSTSPVKDESGNVVKMYGAATDIHDRRESEEALRESEEKLRTVFDSIDQAFCMIEIVRDPMGVGVDYRLLEANGVFELQTGVANARGKLASEYVPGEEPFWLENFDCVARTGEPARVESYHQATRHWYSAFVVRVGDQGSNRVAIVFDDITERKQQEEYSEFLIKLSDILRAPRADVAAIKTEALRLLGEQFNVIRAIYYEADQDSVTLTAQFEKDAVASPDQLRLSDFSPTVAEQYRCGKTQMVTDTENEPNPRAYRAIGLRAWLAVPLIKDGRLVTVVAVHSKTPRKWTEAEVRMLEEFADRLWAAVERANVEQQVRDSERRLRIATEAADMATWEWNLIENKVIWNEQHFRLFGLEPHAGPVDPEIFFEHIHPSDRKRVEDQLRDALANDVEFDTEFLAVLEDGTQRWMSGYGRVMEKSGDQPISISGVMLDITERRQAENDLRRSEERQKAIIESATDYAILTMDLDMRIVDWNVGAQNMMGYSEEEIIGQHGEIFFVAEDRAKGVPAYERDKAIQEGRSKNERWHLRKNGSRFYGSGITSPLLDEAGKVIGLLTVMRDLTHQKRSEEALEEASKRKDEFLAMLAHELRNPLATVGNGIYILKIIQQSDPQVSEIVEMMDNQVTHLVRMIDDLLDVSRVTQGKIQLHSERLEVGALIQNAVKAILPQFEGRGKKLHLSSMPPGLFVHGDQTRLSQVVTNLLTNSLRYTGNDGQAWASLSVENNEVVIQVKDNGIGLSAEQQTSVFELFVQADNSLARSQGGLGIGLTLVRQLVDMHSGRVQAQSPGIGQGSIFTVYLPLLDAPKQPASTQPNGSAKQSTVHILLIDDMEDLARITSMLLKLKGYQVDIRFDGKAGAEAVEALKPAVVLCDIGMPDLDGYQAAGLIRQGAWGSKVTLIALSGYGQEEDKQRSREAGFDGHLLKPVNMDELQSIMSSLTRPGQAGVESDG
ncbi:PAS domain S-box protein [Dyadobacter sp. CY327]|uniref:PAS domain S-box protein n=1 Tax=Dyadobacter sp. CY327 TaxID=2907301 RepID=UPI001F1CF0DA|nr:PAS domain S-box protein [Dyadobacter sp. CY327]MCE7071876.1 PAS domain S-box protein [Dyadobacter sp. CY327]